MPQNQPNDLLRFAGLGTQLLVSIALATWSGIWIDKKCAFTTPVFVWLLPLLAIIANLISIIKQTAKKKDT